MDITAVRGATALAAKGDEAAVMVEALGMLFDALIMKNNISIEDIISIQFTQTADLNKMNAAAALRKARPAFSQVPLFCSLEPEVENSLPRTVRVLITWRGDGPGIPVYMGEAASLRPDLSGGDA